MIGRRIGRAGSAAVEFGLLAPIFMIVMVAITDMGLALDQKLKVQTAARAAAQLAISQPTNSDGIVAAARAAASGLTLTPAPTSVCICAITVSDTTTLQEQACSVTCPANTTATFVRVNVSSTYRPLTSFAPSTLSANVTVQLN